MRRQDLAASRAVLGPKLFEKVAATLGEARGNGDDLARVLSRILTDAVAHHANRVMRKEAAGQLKASDEAWAALEAIGAKAPGDKRREDWRQRARPLLKPRAKPKSYRPAAWAALAPFYPGPAREFRLVVRAIDDHVREWADSHRSDRVTGKRRARALDLRAPVLEFDPKRD